MSKVYLIESADTKILVVEDDLALAATLLELLESDGHRVEVVHNGSEGLDLLKFSGFDLALLDWQLPGLAGPEICSQYRRYGGKAPILMLTQKSAISDKEQGLDSGADDYLAKPFSVRELAARVRALLRRSTTFVDSSLGIGKISLDCGRSVISVDGRVINLVPRELSVMEFLLRNTGTYISSDRLISHIWKSDTEVTGEALRMCINRIRKKIDQPGAPSIIDSVKGLGYRIADAYL